MPMSIIMCHLCHINQDVVGTATPVRTKIVPLSVQFRGDPASRILRCMITRCAWGWIRNCRHYLTSFSDLQFVQMDDGLDGDFVDYFPFSVTSRLVILVRGMLNVCVELKQESCRLYIHRHKQLWLCRRIPLPLSHFWKSIEQFEKLI